MSTRPIVTDAAARLAAVQARIRDACAAAGRSPGDVRLLAASKYADATGVRELAAAGQRLFGENRVQDATAKIAALDDPARPPTLEWHLIGHLQSNKARSAAELFAMVETVDSVEIAEALSRRAFQADRVLPVMLQVNVDADPAKRGFYTGELEAGFEALCGLPSIRVEGLMTIGMLAASPEAARPTFAALRELRERLDQHGVAEPLRHLSMGMSADYEVAILEGATIVRVGSTLFRGDLGLNSAPGS